MLKAVTAKNLIASKNIVNAFKQDLNATKIVNAKGAKIVNMRKVSNKGIKG